MASPAGAGESAAEINPQSYRAVMTAVGTTGFRPSRHGFRFSNSFGDQPVLQLGPLRIGRARHGLCGGMVFAARDFYEAERTVPERAAAPTPDEPLYRFIVRRLFAAFDLAAGGARYWRWMLRPNSDVLARTHQQWSTARALIDGGCPCPLGVVTAQGASPWLLRHNHVVLAYGYEEESGCIHLRVYDPNRGPSDDADIDLSPNSISSTLDVDPAVRGFFVLRYRFREPPGAVG